MESLKVALIPFVTFTTAICGFFFTTRLFRFASYRIRVNFRILTVFFFLSFHYEPLTPIFMDIITDLRPRYNLSDDMKAIIKEAQTFHKCSLHSTQKFEPRNIVLTVLEGIVSEGVQYMESIPPGVGTQFYGSNGNSNKALHMILCGIVPDNKLLFNDIHMLGHRYCLPSVLKSFGYRTAFFTASTVDLQRFFGFDLVVDRNHPMVRKCDLAGPWIMLQEECLRSALKQWVGDDDRPFFIVIETSSTHYNFLPKYGEWSNQKELNKMKFHHADWWDRIETDFNSNVQMSESDYYKSIAYTNHAMKILLQDLPESIQIYTSDHGLHTPLTDNQNLFDIPFIISNFNLDKDTKLPPGNALDVMPSILDMIGVHNPCNSSYSVFHGLVGQSLLNPIFQSKPIYFFDVVNMDRGFLIENEFYLWDSQWHPLTVENKRAKKLTRLWMSLVHFLTLSPMKEL